jgi:hypothetical protein
MLDNGVKLGTILYRGFDRFCYSGPFGAAVVALNKSVPYDACP